ncbi:MAG: histidinol-phosphatase [Firmicutes bacterium]|nr:histidinol-phosphatase [Bacillota bacterium]
MLTDYHTHTERGPYTVEWLTQFLDKAKQGQIAEYGVSEHAYRFKQAASLLDNPWTRERRTEDLDQYFEMVQEARRAGHHVKFGIELDYVPGSEKELARFIESYPFDYIIGSVHWLGDFGFDLLEMKSQWENRDVEKTYSEYFSILTQMVESRLFDFVGHADVIKVFGYEPTNEAFLRSWYERMAETFARYDSVIEVSTAGLRKPVGKMYPAPDFLRACRAANVPILLNSDAHRPEDVGADYDIAIPYAKAAGYDTLTVFTQRERSTFPIG